MKVGETATRTKRVSERESVFLHADWSFRALVHPGDELTAKVEVVELREDKPIARLRTTIANQDETGVLDGTALVWTEPL